MVEFNKGAMEIVGFKFYYEIEISQPYHYQARISCYSIEVWKSFLIHPSERINVKVCEYISVWAGNHQMMRMGYSDNCSTHYGSQGSLHTLGAGGHI